MNATYYEVVYSCISKRALCEHHITDKSLPNPALLQTTNDNDKYTFLKKGVFD